MNDIIYVSGGDCALYGRVDDEHIAPRIINDSDDLDDVVLDLTNIELLSDFKELIHNGNIWFLAKKPHVKSFPTISTAYVMDTMDQVSIFPTITNISSR
jgi:hypothetical protein